MTKTRSLLTLALGLLFCATVVAQRREGDAPARASQSSNPCVPFWVNADGCASPGRMLPTTSANLAIEDYDRCRDGSEMTLYTFANGTHEWPQTNNNDHFSATDAIWKFFLAHPKQ